MGGRVLRLAGVVLVASAVFATARGQDDPVGRGTGGAELTATTEAIPFADGRWDLSAGVVEEHLGREALRGGAVLDGVELGDGVIEVDIACDGRRSYPGLLFRADEDGNGERVYLRPHRAGLYPDAVQYTPVFNGISGWQLYHGAGATNHARIEAGRWATLRLEMKGAQARVIWDGEPVLEIDRLRHGAGGGGIALLGPGDGSAFFSNLRITRDADLGFEVVDPPEAEPGAITDWEIAGPLPAERVDPDAYPHFFTIFGAPWRGVAAEPSGLVDIARSFGPGGNRRFTAFARTTVRSDERRRVKLSIGYSDDVRVFLNGREVYSGVSGYRSRDPSYVGVVGPFETLHVDLERGLNEVFLMVSDSFGGWGFMCRSDTPLDAPVVREGVLEPLWQTEAEFGVPESVLYDRERDVLYVSSFNRVGTVEPGRGFISKLGLDGTVENLRWVEGLDGPCGMGIRGGSLFVVECTGFLVEIDIASGEIVRRYPIPEAEFINDLVVTDAGDVYMTNTARDAAAADIMKLEDGGVRVWMRGPKLHWTNGLLALGDSLVVGNSGDGTWRRVDLAGRAVETITCLGAGVNDGVRPDGEGGLLVSQWRGRLFRIAPDGDVVQIGEMPPGLNCADFEYLPERRLLIVPTFLGNRVVAYRVTL